MVIALTALWLAGCGAAPAPSSTPVQQWRATAPFYIAHRGGDADWVEGTADAYARAVAWNPALALEIPVRLTADGVWVVSEDPTTGRVFGTDDQISRTTWAALSALRTVRGHHPMARLVDDVLAVLPRNRVVFVDDKPNADIPGFLQLLGKFGGPARFVVKSYWQSADLPRQAHQLGYLTWGYYYADNMKSFPATQGRFDLLGLNYDAPAADFAALRATGKPVVAHVIGSAAAAATGLAKGAAGLMVSDVQQVVPHVGATDGP